MSAAVLPATPENLRYACELLHAGQVVAFPTETVYGLGANAYDECAVARIFEAKGRPANNPLIVHVAEPGHAEAIFRTVPESARRLMERFWPGPLSIVLPRSARIPAIVSAGMPTVAVRCPSHPAARQLLRLCKLPIAAPSANASGRPSTTTAQHVFADIGGRIPLIIDDGPCAVGLESTVVDMSGRVPVLLRPGGVTPEDLRAVLPDLAIAPGVLAPLPEGARAASPGLLHRHYAPDAAVTLVEGDPPACAAAMAALFDEDLALGRAPALLAFDDTAAVLGARAVYALGPRERPEDAASRLFALLRAAEADKRSHLYLEAPDDSGLQLALRNRMQRAAGFRVISAADAAPGRPL